MLGLLTTAVWGGLRWQQHRWAKKVLIAVDSASLPSTLVPVLNAARKDAARWPTPQGALERLAVLCLSNGLDETAEPLLTLLCEKHPRDPLWLHRLAVVKGRQGNLEEAVALWRRAAISPHENLALDLKWADALMKLNRLTEAEALYNGIPASHALEPYAAYGLARLAMQREDWVTAKALLTHSLQRSPNFYGNHALLQAVARHEGDDALAEKEDAEIKRMGRFRDVPDPWIDAKREEVFDPKFSRITGDLHFSQQEWEEAGQWYQRTLELDPQNVEAWLWLGASWEQRGDLTQASKAYRSAMACAPSHAKSYYWLSRLLKRQGQEQEALAVLEQGLAAVPSEIGFLLPLARDRLNRSAWIEAIPFLQRAVSLNTDDASLAVELALCHFRVGAPEEGARVLESNHRVHPDHVRTLALLAMQATLSGNEKRAREWLQKLKGAPSGVEAGAPIARQFEARFGHAP